MEYRIATPADLDAFLHIRLETLRTVNRLPDNYPFSKTLIEHTRRYFLTGDQSTALALVDGVPVACATLAYIELMPTLSHPTGHRAHLMNVYTRAGFRRQGIARRLVQMLIEQAKRRGITEISLDATDTGRPFYESLGFRASEECMVLALDVN